MPFYDYKCKKCAVKFEVLRGMNNKFDPACPFCGAKTQQVFYAPRTLTSDKDILDSAGYEQSGSCGTCSSGTCSSCSAK